MCISTRAGVIAAALALLLPSQALPGAWTRPAGEGQLIMTMARSTGPAGTVLSDVPDADFTTSQVYVEYGLIDGLTLGGKAYAQVSGFDPGDNSALAGAFLRKRVWQDGHGGIASVEGGYSHPIEKILGETFQAATWGAVPEAYGGALYGYGWAGDWGSAFTSTGAAYYWRGRGEADQIRAELTGGYAPADWVMGILSFYGLEPLSGGSERSLKIAPSIALSFDFFGKPPPPGKKKKKPPTIQLGFSYDLLNPDDGFGFSVGVWRSF